MTNFEILQEYEKAGVPLPRLNELQEMKEYLDYSIKNRSQLTKQINFWMDKHSELKEENSNLKKLLRDCHYYMVSKNVIKQNSKQLDKEINEILTKIEEVLK